MHSEPGWLQPARPTSLFSIADTIGAFVIEGNVEKHFEILNHKDYYNLGLSRDTLRRIYHSYRGPLDHQSVLAPGVVLDIGHDGSPVFEKRGQTPWINVWPFLVVSKTVVLKFLENADEIVPGSRALRTS